MNPIDRPQAATPNTSLTRRQPLLSIQYLRALAALSVASIHALEQFVHRGQAPHAQFLRWGVDVAFVISGFIMWHILLRQPLTPRAFLYRRVTRIVPLYWAVTGFMVLVMLVAPQFLQTARFNAPHVIASFAFLAWPSPVGSAGMRPVLQAAWTLELEMLFYLIVAAALLLPRRAQQPATIFVLATLAAAGPVLSRIDPIAGFYESPVLLEFALGVGLAMVMARSMTVPKSLCAALIVAGAIGLALAGNHIDRAETNRLLVFGLPATGIIAGLVLLERETGMPRIGWLKSVGDASYSIYLTHTLLISALAQAWKHLAPTSLPPALFVLLALAGSLWLGIAVSVRIERPVSRFLSRPLRGDAGSSRMHAASPQYPPPPAPPPG